MRATLVFLAVFLSGCKSAELAVTHPPTGLHVVARVEARDPAPPAFSDALLATAQALPLQVSFADGASAR
jgi:hypothetical protein